MKSIFTKKVLVIVSIVAFVAIAAIVVAFTTGNINYPGLSNPDEIFYQRLDEEGNVLYSITNEELFEQIKGNDGIDQLLFLTDSFILADYISNVTDDEVADKILELTYGTSDTDDIADLTDEQRDSYSQAFAQTMSLAGFTGVEEEYAKLLIAREAFVLDNADENGVVTEKSVITEYLYSYFDDISAVNIRFTSKADAEFVMEKFNLISLAGIELRLYNGYVFANETLLDEDDEIIEAYLPVDIYYFDEEENILNMDDDIVYTLGVNGIYTDSSDLEYRIDENADLVDGLLEVVLESDKIFADLAAAEVYEEANTVYYTVTRTDAYDMDETINVVNDALEVKFTIDSDGHIWDELNNDVTHTTDLVVNKVYTAIEDVVIVSSNNSTELTDEEVLAKYIQMYNYVYGLYRPVLAEDATVEDLIALDDDFIHFNYDDLTEINGSLSDYMFNQLAIGEDDDRYSNTPTLLSTGTAGYYYMTYKLDDNTKIDVTTPIFEYLEPTVVIPSTIGATITLPKTTYYSGTIAWSSSDSDVISSAGVVVNPEVDTEVELTFTISVLGATKSYTRTVTVLAQGDTEEVTEVEWTEVSLKTVLNNDTVYDFLYNRLLDDYVYGTSGDSNVETTLLETRSDLGFVIYDHYLGIDYQSLDTGYVLNEKGDNELICSFEKTLTSDEAYEVTADQLFTYALTRNAALYTLYAAQDKELLYSVYFEEIFGEQTNLMKNKSARMDDMYTAIDNSKSEYVYYESLYASMGSTFGYSSYIEYAYARYGVKSEMALLQYFVTSELQPHLIQETTELYDVVEALYPEVLDYYDNYFSLDVNQVLIHLDFDEDGSPDDFDAYQASLTVDETTAFNALLGQLEIAIDEFDGTFAELVVEFNNASREDETWGAFKQNGFLIMTESLNGTDDDGVSHSLTYSGTYGVKDTFVTEFVDALIDLYDTYQLPQNLDKDSLYSSLITTEFGLHLIKVEQGDDFEQPTADFTEADSANPEYTVGSENDEEAPSLEQLQLYALYKYYAMVYDLTDADIESRYDIEIPNIPTSVNSALLIYFDNLLSSTYVLGTININIADRIVDGEFLPVSYGNLDNTALMAMLTEVRDVYFEAILGDYITE
ncbi:MAG: hypothetical protein JEZ05_05455 [Tenericutes bacterium]|nr:hypothetical protein [Mycoplasmatota bacterium]